MKSKIFIFFYFSPSHLDALMSVTIEDIFKKIKKFCCDPLKTMLKSPVLLKGYKIFFTNFYKYVHKSTCNFPVLLELYILFFKKVGNLDVQMSVTIEENISSNKEIGGVKVGN